MDKLWVKHVGFGMLQIESSTIFKFWSNPDSRSALPCRQTGGSSYCSQLGLPLVQKLLCTLAWLALWRMGRFSTYLVCMIYPAKNYIFVPYIF